MNVSDKRRKQIHLKYMRASIYPFVQLPIGRIQYVLSQYVPWVNDVLVKCTYIVNLVDSREHRTDKTVGAPHKMSIAKAKTRVYLYVVGDHYRITVLLARTYILFSIHFHSYVMYTFSWDKISFSNTFHCLHQYYFIVTRSSMHAQNSLIQENNTIVRVFN